MVRKSEGFYLLKVVLALHGEGTSVLQTNGNDQIEPSVVPGEITRK